MSDSNHENPSAVCSIEGWGMESKMKRSLQYWLRQQPQQQNPGVSQQAEREEQGGTDSEGWEERRKQGAVLSTLETQSPEFQWRKLTPQAQASTAEGKLAFSFPLYFFACQLRAREGGRLLKIGGISSTFFIILFCLNHLNIQKVDLEAAWHKEKNNQAAEGCWIFNPLTLFSPFSIYYLFSKPWSKEIVETPFIGSRSKSFIL